MIEEFRELAHITGPLSAALMIILWVLWKQYQKELNYNKQRDKEDLKIITELNVFFKIAKDEFEKLRNKINGGNE